MDFSPEIAVYCKKDSWHLMRQRPAPKENDDPNEYEADKAHAHSQNRCSMEQQKIVAIETGSPRYTW